MSFVSHTFALLVIFALLARKFLGKKHTEPAYLAVLLALSLVFYAWHVPSYLFLLLGITALDFVTAKLVAGRRRPALLAFSLLANLALLGLFKYADYFLDGLSSAFFAFGSPTMFAPLGFLLPIGISFYTFHSMSYTIDTYRGLLQPLNSYPRFLLFVSFFPQMMAGPILRAREFLPQFERRRRFHLLVFTEGAFLIVRGLFLKLVVADNLAPLVSRFWTGSTTTADRIAVIVFFAAQIFCDFEGYCSIARGLAYWLGFRIKINFNNPYIATTFKDFWSRWHISLSSWFRDYLYLPLGGNREGRQRTYLNLFIVLSIAGLWHGPNGTFAAWGAIHGVALIVERGLRLEDSKRWVWAILVQVTVLLSWVLFRSATLSQAFRLYRDLFHYAPGPLSADLYIGLPLLLPLAAMHVRGALVERKILSSVGRQEKAVLAAILLWLTLVAYGSPDAFLYFQF